MITAGSEGNLCVYDANQGYLPIKYLATALPTNRVALAVSPDGWGLFIHTRHIYLLRALNSSVVSFTTGNSLELICF